MASVGERATDLRLPRWLLGAGKAAAERVGARTSRFRVAPHYVILGGQRCGTTALNRYLWEHPNVLPAMYKELHYFDLNHDRGFDWYLGHFPTRWRMSRLASARGGVALTGEATPYYLFHPLVPERLTSAVPDARLIVMLRDPVARAISHYHHERRLGVETLSLPAALDAEADRLAREEERLVRDPAYASFAHQHFSYQARGRYAEQLERWLGRVPRERILIVDADRFFAAPAEGFRAVTSFLGLPPVERGSFRPHNAQDYAADDAVVSRLRAYFEPHDGRLAELLGIDPAWR